MIIIPNVTESMSKEIEKVIQRMKVCSSVNAEPNETLQNDKIETRSGRRVTKLKTISKSNSETKSYAEAVELPEWKRAIER